MTDAIENTASAKAPLTFSPIAAGEPVRIGDGFMALQFRHDRFAPGAMSPFVLVDHFHMRAPTFDVHPHAGMSAVTLMFEDTEGEMASRDSIGHNATFGAGDLHWTLAGRGILHTQLPLGTASHIHALQIFVNLPTRLKDVPPDSFWVAASAIPQIHGAGFRLRVVAGEFGGRASPARTPEPVLMLDGYLDAPSAPVDIPVPAHWNAWIYLVDGTMSVGGTSRLTAGHALCVGPMSQAGTLSCITQSAAHFVVLAGPRIDEPVVQRGPFVFESEASLTQALADFQAGRFGKVVGVMPTLGLAIRSP